MIFTPENAPLRVFVLSFDGYKELNNIVEVDTDKKCLTFIVKNKDNEYFCSNTKDKYGYDVLTAKTYPLACRIERENGELVADWGKDES